ncbi:MAG: PrgI family protein [Patescibacteria group bacterium]
MQEHPIPRQITTFEFKLIGELTLKQFGFLAFGSVVTLIVYFLVPGFLYLNFIIAAVPALLALGFAFVPVNERPMDVWLKNLILRLSSPTQYYFKKNNLPPKILLGVTLPPRALQQQHVEAKQMLNAYLQSKPKTTEADNVNSVNDSYETKQKQMKELLTQTVYVVPPIIQDTHIGPKIAVEVEDFQALPKTEKATTAATFTLTGTVISPNGLLLPNVMVYLKKGKEVIRLFKTGADGVFTNNIPIPAGQYVLELEDPTKKYVFDRLNVDGSKEVLEIYAQKA